MTGETLFDAVRRAIETQGGANAAARALDLSPRAVQRAKAGDASPELARDIIGATRIPLWALEQLARSVHDAAPRASARRLEVFAHIARQGEATMRDVCDAIARDPNDSAVHQHISALIDMGWVDASEPETTTLGGRARTVSLTPQGWRALGIAADEVDR
ncbi:MAG: MarR family winged helix-turn-helix transcriptional regulator [Pseudomonadota bacterium]